MQWSLVFFVNSILLGIGLAMDAFSVSLADGLNEPDMTTGRMNIIAGTYGFFQFLMPMAGWICVHTIVKYFRSFEKFIPWIALILLLYIGGEMFIEGIRPNKKNGSEKQEQKHLCPGKLIVQGIATSIDALSVGFTIESHPLPMALTSSLIIALTTHVICIVGLCFGRKIGTKLENKASVLGGVILIAIGIEIFVTGI